jgi:hypothetical protein
MDGSKDETYCSTTIVRGKKLLNRDLTPYELQIFFAFEKEDKLKKVAKLLEERTEGRETQTV